MGYDSLCLSLGLWGGDNRQLEAQLESWLILDGLRRVMHGWEIRRSRISGKQPDPPEWRKSWRLEILEAWPPCFNLTILLLCKVEFVAISTPPTNLIYPPRQLICPLKRDHLKREFHNSKHQFSWDMIVFERVFNEVKLRKGRRTFRTSFNCHRVVWTDLPPIPNVQDGLTASHPGGDNSRCFSRSFFKQLHYTTFCEVTINSPMFIKNHSRGHWSQYQRISSKVGKH